MGTVFEAWQRSLQRTVALKVLASHVSSSSAAIGRFQREAQAAAKLQHGHIIPIFAQGEERGVYYYAMELVEGRSLNAILNLARDRRQAETARLDLAVTIPIVRSGASGSPTGSGAVAIGDDRDEPGPTTGSKSRLVDSVALCTSPDQFAFVCEQIAQVADALQYAHERGVVHRDIKPHNLMLGQDGRLRVADFGLARVSENPGVTVTGEMIGSPMYMSPEQITEGPSKIDSRTDVYSLGVTFYEWLTLSPPFLGETRELVISRIVSAEPAPPRVLNPALPTDLEIICLKAIERNRTRRYQTAGEFRDDLRRYLTERPIRAKRASLALRARRILARHPVAAAMGFMTVVASVAVASTIALVRRQTLVKATAEVEKKQVIAEQVRIDEVQQKVEDADRALDLVSSLGSLVPEFGALLQGAKVATAGAGGLVRQGAELSGVIGGEEKPASAPPAVLATPTGIARRAVRDIYESVHQPSWPMNLIQDGFGTLLRYAVSLRESDPKSALGMVGDYLKTQPDDFHALQLRAALSGQVGNYQQMAADADQLVRLQPQNPFPLIWRGLARVLLDEGEAGRQDLTRALELDATLIWARALLGLAMLEEGNASEAISTFEEVLQRMPTMGVALFGRASAHAALGRFDRATADVTRALETQPDDAEALLVRCDYRCGIGDWDGALRDLDRVGELAGQSPAVLLRSWFILMQKRGPDKAEETRPPKVQLPVDADEEMLYPVKGTVINPFVPRPRTQPSGAPLIPAPPPPASALPPPETP